MWVGTIRAAARDERDHHKLQIDFFFILIARKAFVCSFYWFFFSWFNFETE